MKAMVLAAGLGTRLRPLTNQQPKALVEIGGRTLLEMTLTRLREFGVREVIINVHHFANMIEQYLHINRNFGLHIEISREEELLDTGGGLKKAGWFFLEYAQGSVAPFLLHNVDGISTFDFDAMVAHHKQNAALATLAVQERKTSRHLLFNQRLQLCGRRLGRDKEPEVVRPSTDLKPLAFTGIHVISPRLLTLMTEGGVFSIVSAYLRLAAQGEIIQGFRADDYYWRDLGKLDQVQQAERDFQQKLFF